MTESLAVGASASLDRTFTADDMAAFAPLSGDDNPIHLWVESDEIVVDGEATVVVRSLQPR